MTDPIMFKVIGTTAIYLGLFFLGFLLGAVWGVERFIKEYEKAKKQRRQYLNELMGWKDVSGTQD